MSFLQSRTRSAREGFGKPVLRKDDARMLVGDGCYSDDVNLAGQVYACFVRSPHAHARIRRVETDAALATPGVIAVLTGEDAAADEIKPITHSPMPGNPHEDMIRTGDVAFIAPHPPIAADRARFVGEIVAMVVADTPAAARDGAERVVVDWTPLPAVTASVTAAGPGAPRLYDGAAARPARQVDGRAAGSVPGRLSRARSRVARRAGARRHRRLPRVSRRQYQQRRRPRGLVPSPQQGHGDLEHGLPRAGGVDARARRRHEHVADYAIPQRGTPRGDVRHGAADRSGGAPSRVRSPRAAAEEAPGHERDAGPERLRRGL